MAVDFTKSNEWTGSRTFGGRCLHDVSGGPQQQAAAAAAGGSFGGGSLNPYQLVRPPPLSKQKGPLSAPQKTAVPPLPPP